MGEPLTCYPNPSTGVMHICYDSEMLNVDEISIYDMQGRKVYAQSCSPVQESNETIIQPTLAAGVYVLKVGNRAIKIVKQ